MKIENFNYLQHSSFKMSCRLFEMKVDETENNNNNNNNNFMPPRMPTYTSLS